MAAGGNDTFTYPNTSPLQWLCRTSLDISDDIHETMLAGMFGAPKVIYAGVFCTLGYNIMAVFASPSLLFFALLPAGLLVNLVRVIASAMAAQAAASGRKVPTDFYMGSAIAWYAIEGICCGAGMLSGVNALQLIGLFMVMGASGAVTVRQFGAPRFAILAVCLCTVPECLGALLAPDHWLIVLGVMLLPYTAAMASITRKMEKTAAETLQARHESHQFARADFLTGVLNRFGLMETLASMRNDGVTDFALFCLDLDEFKQINDRHGHIAGDHLLKSVASRLTGLARPGDTVARLGGDEFLVLAPHMAPEEAPGFARLIRQVITAQPHELGNGTLISIDASIGFASAPKDGTTFPVLYHAADAGLYAAKAAQRAARRVLT
jgi:diguanylate cyclase (GGDEF)-like protein